MDADELSTVTRAVQFASKAHENQKRKYTNEPYFNHCASVAHLVAVAGGDYEMIAAAYLHDVIEDTDTPIDEIEMMFGFHVAGMVRDLTDTPKELGNRKWRKARDRERLAAAENRVKTIKLADLVDNTSTITKYDPDFAKVYMEEKRALLPSLRGGASWLLNWANGNVDRYFRETPND